MTISLHIKKTFMAGLSVVALIAIWQAGSRAQEPSSGGIVTVFGHAKVEASFARAAAKGGTDLLWGRTSSQGTYNVNTHNRAAPCRPEGCRHGEGTDVVLVVSGAATLVIAGAAKAAEPDKFGGELVQGGESHRVSKGDVFIMPPNTTHWYKDQEAPFHYISVAVP